MVKKYRPRAGSLAFYPRKRAARELASFRSFPAAQLKDGETSKPLNFLGYKAGMTHVMGRDSHERGTTFGHEVAVPVTVVEVPPLKVFGVRAYSKAKQGFYGTAPLLDVFAGSVDKSILRKMPRFRQRRKKKEKPGKKKKQAEKRARTFEDLLKEREKITAVKLLCHSQPGLTNMGKKKPDVCEIALSGSVEQQLQFAKEKLGKELGVKDAFGQQQFVDARAVSKGKGMQGVVKRFGVKMHRPKAKKRRVVGSIGPWNPSTVMWTVARAGQMGYHSRTEHNKKILKLGGSGSTADINPKSGFKKYGVLQSDFLLLSGSVVGPAKRAVSLRQAVRPPHFERHKLEAIDYVGTSAAKPAAIVEEEVKVQKVVAEKHGKEGKKSVADEIAAAAKGEEKREKKKE